MQRQRVYLLLAFALLCSTRSWSMERHFITEKLDQGLTQLLVIDSDSERGKNQAAISQSMVLKKNFSDQKLLQETIHYYKTHQLQKTHLPAIGRPLWVPIKNEWSADDETKYQDWFTNQVNYNFLSGSGLRADCADVGLVFRWIYARNNHLPIANTLPVTRRLFGHFSSSAEWDQLHEDPDWRFDERFKAALMYLFDNTYTHSVFNDLYPTLINPQYVHPGSLFIFLRARDGHTQTLRSIDGCDQNYVAHCIQTLWGNEPASDRIFYSSLIAPDNYFGNTNSGFKMWRWPRLNGTQWELTPAEQMPGYSLEQYHVPNINPGENNAYLLWVLKKLGYQAGDEDLAVMYSDQISHFLAQRAELVAAAQPYCVLQPCAPGSQMNDEYSTNARDQRLIKTKSQLDDVLQRLGSNNATVQKLKNQYSFQFHIYGLPLSDWGFMTDTSGLFYRLSSDAQASYSERWGLGRATGHPDLELISAANVVWWLFVHRIDQISLAQNICYHYGGKQVTCNPSNPDVQMLSTLTIDSAIQTRAAELEQFSHDANVNQDVLKAIQTAFNFKIDSYTFCNQRNDNTPCTAADLNLGVSAIARMKHWSSQPQDVLLTRWGF